MRWVILCCVWLPLLASGAVRAEVNACLQGEAEAWLQASGVPGLSIAMRSVRGDAYTVAVGVDAPVDGEPLEVSHRLRIASLSKPITALVVIALVDEGRLGLDSQVFGARGVLGGRWPAVDRMRWVDRLTVRHLLEHGGGLGGWEYDPMFVLGDDDTPRGELVATALARYPLRARPGREFVYSNLGYLILGEVVEHVSGRAYEEQVRATVLRAAEVEGLRVGRNGREGRWPGEVAYAGEAAYRTVRPQRFGPFGGWVATPGELLDLLASVAAPTSGSVSGAMRQRMLRPSAPRHPGGRPSHYGLGWEVDRDGYGHFGAMPGTQALMRQNHSGAAWVAIANGLPPADPEGRRLQAMLVRAHARCLR